MLLSTAAQNASLDNDYGDNAGASSPASFVAALFHGDPANGGTELASDGGYARITVTNDSATFPGAVDGLKSSAVLDFGTSTGAWSDTATHWALYDASDGTTGWDSGQLAAEQDVTTAGTPVTVVLSIFYNGRVSS